MLLLEAPLATGPANSDEVVAHSTAPTLFLIPGGKAPHPMRREAALRAAARRLGLPWSGASARPGSLAQAPSRLEAAAQAAAARLPLLTDDECARVASVLRGSDQLRALAA